MKARPAELALLRLIAEAGGSLSHDDDRLDAFCGDREPDTFNSCHGLGWLKTTHDFLAETSVVALTKHGRELLENNPVPAGTDKGAPV